MFITLMLKDRRSRFSRYGQARSIYLHVLILTPIMKIKAE